MEKRLYRSRSDRVIWGVCGGLARHFNIDPTIVRIIAVLLVFANGTGVLAYIILTIVVPLESSTSTTTKEVIEENVEEMKGTADQIGHEIRSTFTGQAKTPGEPSKARQHSYNIVGITLIVLGILFLLASFNFLWWLHWNYIWPLILIVIGILIMVGANRK